MPLSCFAGRRVPLTGTGSPELPFSVAMAAMRAHPSGGLTGRKDLSHHLTCQ
jgi:hypothetical protein